MRIVFGWQRLLGRPAFEYGTLYVTGMGLTDGATAPPEGANAGYPHVTERPGG